MSKSTRNNSTIELIRIIMLSFLIITHWGVYWHYNDWLDTSIMHEISEFSVTTFAIITGAYAFKKKSMLWKNISRIFYIIILSIIMSTIIYKLTINDPMEGLIVGAMGGNYSWYLYSILPVYAIFPLMKNWIDLKRGIYLTLFFFAVYFALRYTVGEIYFDNLAPPSTFLSARTINLFADALLGYVIFEIVQKVKLTNSYYYMLNIFICLFVISLITIGLSGVIIHNNYISGIVRYEDFLFSIQFFIIIGSASLIGIAHMCAFHSKAINWIAINSYFIYEFHGLWQLIWITIFPTYFLNNLHADLYVHWLVITAFGFAISLFFTLIQKKFWDRYITRPIQEKINRKLNNTKK